ARSERAQDLREVTADLGAEARSERPRGWTRDLHVIGDPRAAALERLHAVGRPHDDLAEVGLVDEEVGLDQLADPKLDPSRPPCATGPPAPGRPMSLSPPGPRATSAHNRQIASSEALVSMLCSACHTLPSLVYAQMICVQTILTAPWVSRSARAFG